MNNPNLLGQLNVPIVVGSGDLLGVLGDDQKNSLTADKAAWIMKRDGSQVTGFVVTDKNGLSAIVYKSAARWLTNDEMWWLMHESESPLNTPNVES